MIEKRLAELLAHYQSVQNELSDPEITKDQKRYRALMQESAALQDVAEEARQLEVLEAELGDARELVAEAEEGEMRDLAQEEVADLEQKRSALVDRIKVLLVPKDPNDNRNILMEIRAGTGGDEAALFASDLYRMYGRYAEGRGWKTELMATSATEIGGFKEAVFSVTGKGVYADLRYESGVHRVQRVPVTETSGRIHTSAVTVAVLPEAEETEVEIKNEEIRVDVYRSSGPGGQSVNTTDSAVRLTHIPTGLVVTCQDEKSQHKNKAKALRVLRARLYELEESKKQAERAQARRSQVGSGDRSERIRTYNFPQNRVTDHRINLTLYKLDAVMEGSLQEVVEALKLSATEEYLAAGEPAGG